MALAESVKLLVELDGVACDVLANSGFMKIHDDAHEGRFGPEKKGSEGFRLGGKATDKAGQRYQVNCMITRINSRLEPLKKKGAKTS